MIRPARLYLIACIAAGAATPASGDEAARCWSYAANPGLFAWTQAPSTACRDGEDVTGAGVAPGPLPVTAPGIGASGADTPANLPTPATGLTFSFSGTASVGVAVAF
jgi:hypothetical protein